MKLFFIFLSSLAITNNTGSQVNTTGNVPQNIIASFSAKYAGAHVINWKAGKDDYEANFKLSGKKYCAFFSAGGDWQKTERKIRPWQLPVAVKTSMKIGGYAAWYIDEAKEVNMPGQHVYLVHVDNAPVLTIPDPYLFKDDYQLTFSESGELTKKEKLP